jgi:hypothetical protein
MADEPVAEVDDDLDAAVWKDALERWALGRRCLKDPVASDVPPQAWSGRQLAIVHAAAMRVVTDIGDSPEFTVRGLRNSSR